MFSSGASSVPYITHLFAGFVLRAIGSCDGHAFVETAEQCAAAAEALGLEDTIPNSDANGDINTRGYFGTGDVSRPHGCYWKEINLAGAQLFFNPDGDRDDNDTGRVSICSKCSISKCPREHRLNLSLSIAIRLCSARIWTVRHQGCSETHTPCCETFLQSLRTQRLACFRRQPRPPCCQRQPLPQPSARPSARSVRTSPSLRTPEAAPTLF